MDTDRNEEIFYLCPSVFICGNYACPPFTSVSSAVENPRFFVIDLGQKIFGCPAKWVWYVFGYL
jgi:hypothetical protein